MRRVVDPQKNRLYAAEAVLAKRDTLYPEIRDVRAYVDKVRKRKLVRTEFPRAAYGVEILDGRGRRSGCGDWEQYYISLPRWTRTTHYILHELAHVWVGDMRTRGCTPHGRFFVGAYLMLVDEFMGVTAGFEFREKLREHRVDWTSWEAPRSFRPHRVLSSRA